MASWYSNHHHDQHPPGGDHDWCPDEPGVRIRSTGVFVIDSKRYRGHLHYSSGRQWHGRRLLDRTLDSCGGRPPRSPRPSASALSAPSRLLPSSGTTIGSASAYCSPRTIYGSSIERTAKLHPLWQEHCRGLMPMKGCRGDDELMKGR
jgi:hypothetical protein